MEEKKKDLLENATGEIRFTLLNDYMFHVVVQENEEVLKRLTCAMLHIKEEDIKEIHVENPIVPGAAIDNKEFILDINVTLNGNVHINYELQIINEGNWPDRSLSYLCRSFDRLYHGQDYSETSRVIHIGILNFTLFEDAPEFYAHYRVCNVNNHRIFNDKMELNVLELNSKELATPEDRKYHLNQWAALFKAKTWEGLRMLTEEYTELKTAGEKLYVYNADQDMRNRCEARELYLLEEARKNAKMEMLETELAEKNAELLDKNLELEHQKQEIAKMKKLLEQNGISVEVTT